MIRGRDCVDDVMRRLLRHDAGGILLLVERFHMHARRVARGPPRAPTMTPGQDVQARPQQVFSFTSDT
jgi:hypothetical protein